MSLSPVSAADNAKPVSNLAHLHKQHRSHAKVHDTPQARGRNTSRYELGRKDRFGDKVTRIYPRDMYVDPVHHSPLPFHPNSSQTPLTSPRTKSPPSTTRLSSTSPPVATNYNATTSPLLSALGATRTSSAQYTNEWTKSIPYYTNQASPGTGGIPIAGSPPTFQNSPGARDGLYAQQAMSNSPPGMRP
jgi:hypothetical protein